MGDRETLPGRIPGALPPLSLDPPPPAPPRVAIAIGFAMGRERALRRPLALAALLGAALVVVSAIIERRVGSAGAVDRVLVATFNLVVPLVSFGVAAEVSARRNLRDAVWSAARFGVARRDVAIGAFFAAALASMALCGGLAILAVLLAHGEGNPPLARDLAQSAEIAALAAAAYSGWFALGSTFGKAGGGRWWALVADFVLGASTGIAGAILPRGNATNLLGGAAPLALSQASSSAILALSAIALGGLAAIRCRE
jgi:hypothetical protein